MCAYNVADIHDSCDDGEDHGGLLLARLLKNAGKINNDIAIFVARETGPDQLGAKRFSIIRTIAQELFQILKHRSTTADLSALASQSSPSYTEL